MPSVTFRAAPAENPWASVDLGGRIELGFHVKALNLYWFTILDSPASPAPALHWDPPADDGGQAPHYAIVYRGDFPGHHEFVTHVVDTTEVTFDKASLHAFGNATFQVVPINSYGAGPLCPPVTVPDPA
ncbi:fibronectin type III domain-containing protein [Kitasatospora griseola]|uniref:fibronectin type III domain-containing protein n=1 Tax=Kitasatospora griseola TaxID=2064 RepID=UPI00382639EA